MSVTKVAGFILTLILTSQIEEIKEAVFWPDKTCYSDLGEFLKIGIPQAAMLCFEWWVFELLVFAAGYLSLEDQTAMAILFNLSFFSFSIANSYQ